MTHRKERRIRARAMGMNRNATAALVLALASAGTFGLWKLGWDGPAYARVLSVTAVTVREPRYLDVVQAVPVPGSGDASGRPQAWQVSYREGERVRRTLRSTEPGDQVLVGVQRRIIGYDVAWRWRERTGVARLTRPPGKRLPVVGGAVAEGPRKAG